MCCICVALVLIALSGAQGDKVTVQKCQEGHWTTGPVPISLLCVSVDTCFSNIKSIYFSNMGFYKAFVVRPFVNFW